ncbi:uncharacterized protein LOC143295086 [Babylonia areolata]|uniref:uncharacterized protein LOC143295086 n=1 Tax=Babylonia areolata TaxID=304850 RepID=UPI003FD16263
MCSILNIDAVELVVSAIPQKTDFPFASVFTLSKENNEIVPVETFNADPAKNDQQNYEDIIQKLTQDRQEPYYIVWKLGRTPVLMLICMEQLSVRVKMLFRNGQHTLEEKLPSLPSIFARCMADLEYKNFIKLVPGVQEPLP